MDFGNNGMGFGNSDVRVYHKFGLGCRVSRCRTEIMERTLKT